ncbi:hypothetical protein [Subsaximicrobium wynnwilliamsii]|nr:hypothetical protein [Subsaximicrobium wynnwilliamsii]
MLDSILNKKEFKPLTRKELQIIVGGGTCTLTATNGLKVVVPDREGDSGYCKRLCDNAPGCASVE